MGMQLGAAQAAQMYQQQQLEQQRAQMALEQQRQANNAAMAQQSLELEKQKQAQVATQMARKYQAVQEYQRRAAMPGADPLKLLMELGPGMEHQGAVEAAIVREQAKQQRLASLPGGIQAVPITGPDGKPVPHVFGLPTGQGGFHYMTDPGYNQQLMADRGKWKAAYDTLNSDRKAKMKMLAPLASAKPGTQMYLAAQKLQQEIDSITKKLEAMRYQDPTVAGSPASYDPTTGELNHPDYSQGQAD